jgi:cytochrome c
MRKIIALATIALLSVGACSVAVAQDHATAEEVVAKVREAASTLSKTGDLAQFNQKQSPWVWKDAYIYVVDCDKKVEAAHPIKAELIGKDVSSIKDTKGSNVYPDNFCSEAKRPSGVWIEYWWPKPGDKEGSRKISYNLGAEGTPYVVGAGIHDDKASVTELSELSTKK